MINLIKKKSSFSRVRDWKCKTCQRINGRKHSLTVLRCIDKYAEFRGSARQLFASFLWQQAKLNRSCLRKSETYLRRKTWRGAIKRIDAITLMFRDEKVIDLIVMARVPRRRRFFMDIFYNVNYNYWLLYIYIYVYTISEQTKKWYSANSLLKTEPFQGAFDLDALKVRFPGCD